MFRPSTLPVLYYIKDQRRRWGKYKPSIVPITKYYTVIYQRSEEDKG